MSSQTLDAGPARPERLAEPSSAAVAARYGLTVPGQRPPFWSYVRSLVAYRHFTFAYARARVASVYSSARLGPIWNVLTPLLHIGVYYLVFGWMLDRKAGSGQSYIGFLSIGVFVFSYTREAFAVGTKSVADRMTLIRALSFPRALLPLAVVVQQLIILAFSLGIVVWILLAVGDRKSVV